MQQQEHDQQENCTQTNQNHTTVTTNALERTQSATGIKLTLLQLMAVLGIIGVLSAWVLHYFFE